MKSVYGLLLGVVAFLGMTNIANAQYYNYNSYGNYYYYNSQQYYATPYSPYDYYTPPGYAYPEHNNFFKYNYGMRNYQRYQWPQFNRYRR